jgi:hypothetical protein
MKRDPRQPERSMSSGVFRDVGVQCKEFRRISNQVDTKGQFGEDMLRPLLSLTDQVVYRSRNQDFIAFAVVMRLEQYSLVHKSKPYRKHYSK